MKVAPINNTSGNINISEEVERRSSRLCKIWERDVTRRGDDLHEARKLLVEIDEVMPGLGAYEARLNTVLQPANSEEIAQYLIAIRANFHNSKATGELYGRIMTERVAAKQPSFAALEWATRDIIDHHKFMPVTAEILEAIDSASTRLQHVVDLVRTLPARRQRLIQMIERESPSPGPRG